MQGKLNKAQKLIDYYIEAVKEAFGIDLTK